MRRGSSAAAGREGPRRRHVVSPCCVAMLSCGACRRARPELASPPGVCQVLAGGPALSSFSPVPEVCGLAAGPHAPAYSAAAAGPGP